ncbi:MAG: HupE/UreJ family protein [Pseudomonadota bacterium]|jgi:urease accessory protein
MRNRTHHPKTLSAAALLAACMPGIALAHPGHGFGDNLMEGLLHPLTGLDHVLMLLAVSAWAARLALAGRMLVAACMAVFVGIGALAPVGAGAMVEAAIALTVVGAGILLAMERRWPAWATGAVAAAFALVHGFAHGAEGPASGAYIGGLVLATGTAALLVSTLTALLRPRIAWLRTAGLTSAALGIAALAG